MAASEGASGEPSVQVVRRVDMAALEKRFRALADEWKSDVEFMSLTSRMVLRPAYQQIIGMGPDAIPLLLRELDERPHHWFWALKSITGCDPVPERSRGNFEETRAAWLEWGKAQGYQW